MKFKVGDKVKAIKDVGLHSDDYKIGEVYQITKVDEDDVIYSYKINGIFWCMEQELELVEEKNKFKIGQRVKIKRTGKNAEILDIIDNEYLDDGASYRCYKVAYEVENNKSVLGWFTVHDLEEVEEILNEKEKEYLSAVIKPFKRYVNYIEKVGWEYEDDEYIRIVIKKENEKYIVLPYFEKNSMYKGMEINKEYTLEELGL